MERKRYWSDHAYREKIKEKSRNFWKRPGVARIRKATMARRYRNDRDYREKCRTRSRLQCLLLTDSFIRTQLSRVSHKPANQWTAAEVSARRVEILAKRSRRLNITKAKEIRSLAGEGNRFELAVKFNVSPTLVWMILANQIHHDPDWKPQRRIRSWLKTSAFFKMFAAGEQLSKALQVA